MDWPVDVSEALSRRFAPDKVLGDGPNGLVLRCRDLASGANVVLKHSRAQHCGDEVLNKRFLRESRALAKLDHPGIMRVVDCGEDLGARYLILEHLEGPALSDVVEGRGPVPVAQAVRVTAAILDALDHVHRCEIFHRDVKPDNIVLAPRRGPVLIDFGIARTLLDSQALTQSGMMVGTPAYLAPEIIVGEDADAGSDLYSAALVLHYLLLGRPTFRRPKVLDSLQAQMEDAPEPIPAGGQALKDLLARWLSKEPTARPAPSARQWKLDLERAAGS